MTITKLARQAIEHYLQTGHDMPVPVQLPENLRGRAGLFVSLHQPDGELRGCIGTTAPTTPSIAAEVIANAAAAATQDPRFERVGLDELANLSLSVDVLSPAVPERDLSQLDPKRFGIIVSSSLDRRGVLLPDLDGVDTVEQQIAICRDKAEIGPHEPISVSKFEVKRFHEA